MRLLRLPTFRQKKGERMGHGACVTRPEKNSFRKGQIKS